MTTWRGAQDASDETKPFRGNALISARRGSGPCPAGAIPPAKAARRLSTCGPYTNVAGVTVAESKRSRAGLARGFRSRFKATSRGGGRPFALGLMTLALGAALASLLVSGDRPANAQETVYIGGDGGADVIVDLEVLDSFRTGGPLQVAIDPGAVDESAGVIRLIPPRERTGASTAVPLMRPSGETAAATTPAMEEKPAEPAPSAAPEAVPEVEVGREPAEAPGRRSTDPAVEAPAEPAFSEPSRSTVEQEPAPVWEAEPAFSEPSRSAVEQEPAPVWEAEPAQAMAREMPARQEIEVTVPVAPQPRAAEPQGSEPRSDGGQRVAALDGGAVPNADLESLRLPFSAAAATLPPGARALLDRLAALLDADQALRLQLKAYAGGDSASASQARRLSLSRALAVRSFFIEQGVRSTRIDVRALGNRTEETPVDRVDILVIKR